MRGLDAGAGEDQYLRIGVDVELLQNGRQVAPAVGSVIELDLLAFELLFETRDGVGCGSRVVDGGIVQGDVERIFQTVGEKNRAHGNDEKTTQRYPHPMTS